MVCAPTRGGWLVVGAVDAAAAGPGEVRTRLRVAELWARLGAVDPARVSGQVVLRSGERLDFSGFQQRDGVLVVAGGAPPEELAGARVELFVPADGSSV